MIDFAEEGQYKYLSFNYVLGHVIKYSANNWQLKKKTEQIRFYVKQQRSVGKYGRIKKNLSFSTKTFYKTLPSASENIKEMYFFKKLVKGMLKRKKKTSFEFQK